MAAGIRAGAEEEAERLRKAEVLKGREEAIRAREEWEREESRRREDIERFERRLQEREESLDRKFHLLDEKQQQQDQRAEALARREKGVEARDQELGARFAEVQHRLESLAGLSADEARRQLMHDMEEAPAPTPRAIREVKEEARATPTARPRSHLARHPAHRRDHTAETTVSWCRPSTR